MSSPHAETLRGKVIWITGAGSGIGRQLAVSLARRGARLVLHSLPGEELDAVKALCLSKKTRESISLHCSDVARRNFVYRDCTGLLDG